jgi:hypothetical protein
MVQVSHMPLTIPATGLRKLEALRARERLILVFWGAVRWLTLAVSLLVFFCLIDWTVDRYGSLTARETVRDLGASARRNFSIDFSHDAENRMAIRWMNHFDATPLWLRYGCSLVLFGTLLVSGWYWLVRPWTKAPSLVRLAVRAEKAFPDFDHRLVTAIQLTRSHARTEGMSKQLIDIVASESEELAGRHNLNQLANYRLFKQSALLLLAPIALLGLALLGFGAERFQVLCERQALASVEIPRKTKIQDTSAKIFVADGEMVLTFEVTGSIPGDGKGTLIVLDKDGGCPEYELKLVEKIDNRHAIFSARVIANANFKYRAWVSDGRSAGWAEATIEPRPQVAIAGAWMLMPGYVPLNEDGSRVEVLQRYGDLRLHPPSFIQVPLEPSDLFLGTRLTVWDPGSLARIRVYVQKPVAEVKLTLLDRRQDDADAIPLRSIVMDAVELETLPDGSQRSRIVRTGSAGVAAQPEDQPDGSKRYYYEAMIAADFIPLDGQRGADIVANYAGGMIDLKHLRNMRPDRYRVSAVDFHGFESRKDPHRSIIVEPPDLPHVELLPERYPLPGGSITEEDIIKDLPIPPGEKVKIEYVCRSTVGFADPVPGLGNRLNSPARLMVRVNEETVPRIYLLDEIPQTLESGEYDVQRATFKNQAFMERMIKDMNGVPFHAKPGGGPRKDLPRRDAGGVYYFATSNLQKIAPDGSLKDLEIGDSLEFWIEVTDRAGNRVTEQNSPKRRKEIRSADEVARQSIELLESETRLRSIEKRQRELGEAIISGKPKKK